MNAPQLPQPPKPPSLTGYAIFFITDVLDLLWSMCKGMWRGLVWIEQGSARFFTRLIRVEKRIRSFWPKLLFPFRWLRFILYRLHILPPWAKVAKLLFLIAVLVVWQFWGYIQRYHEIQATYDLYYPKMYHDLIARKYSDADARFYADYLANLYAEYYASRQFKVAQESAIPLATPKTVSFPKHVPNASAYLTEAGVTLVKRFEGVRLEPYKDVGGKLTIGYGHLIRPGEYFSVLTEAEAEALLKQDLQVAEAIVKRNVKVPLTPYQYSALVSLVFNIGQGHFENSTLLEVLNQGDYQEASRQFMRWVHVDGERIQGLVNRRIAERQMFTGEYRMVETG